MQECTWTWMLLFHISQLCLGPTPTPPFPPLSWACVRICGCSNANAAIKGYVKMKSLAAAAIRISDRNTHVNMHTHPHTHTHTAPAMLSYHALATPTDCSISPPISPRLPAVARDTIGAPHINVERKGVAEVWFVDIHIFVPPHTHTLKRRYIKMTTNI